MLQFGTSCCYEGEGRTASSSSFTLITYRDIPNRNIQHKNAPEDGLLKSENVELLNVMNKIDHEIFCILLDYRYIVQVFIISSIWFALVFMGKSCRTAS